MISKLFIRLSDYAQQVAGLDVPLQLGVQMRVAGYTATWTVDPAVPGEKHWVLSDLTTGRIGLIHVFGGVLGAMPEGTEQELIGWLETQLASHKKAEEPTSSVVRVGKG